MARHQLPTPAATDPAPADHAPARPRALRVYSSAADAPRARRPTDILLLISALLAVALLSTAAPGPTHLDQTITDFLTSLPGLAGWLWEMAFAALTAWQLLLIALVAVNRRRRRLLGDFVLAAALALAGALAASLSVGTTWSDGVRALYLPGPPAVYLAVRVALFTSVIVTASPHLSRPLRYVGRALLGIGGIAGIVLGVALPIGTAAGFLVGVAAAATTHLILGSPGGRPTRNDVAEGLGELGLGDLQVVDAPLQLSGVAVFRATAVGADPGTGWRVKAYGADAWEGQLLTSTWASLWRRGETPDLVSGRLARAEHEALATMMAARAGVPVLPIVAVGSTSDDDVLLVSAAPAGYPLQSAPPGADGAAATTNDPELAATIGAGWQALSRLHAAGLAHGAIGSNTVVRAANGQVALTDFASATLTPAPRDQAIDDAQYLVTAALACGPERALHALLNSADQQQPRAATAGSAAEGPLPGAASDAGAIAEDDVHRLGAALPYLQPACLDPATRRSLRGAGWKLADLRSQTAAAVAVEVPELERLARFQWRAVAKVALIGIFAYWLIGSLVQVDWSSVAAALRDADVVWLGAALALSPVIQVFLGFATLGASATPLRYGPVLMLQYAIGFIALLVPASAARVALEVRFFQCFGIPVTAAISIGVIDSLSGFTVQLVLLVVIWLTGVAAVAPSTATDTASTSSSDSTLVVAAVALVALGALAVAVVPGWRNRVRAAIPRARAAMSDQLSQARGALTVLRSPARIGQMVSGNLAAQVLQAVILGLCLKAFGQQVDLAGLILVNTFVSLFAGLMPVPGGMGVAEAGYTAGLQALGVPSAIALSTAMMFRMVTFYLPPLWGSAAMRWLRTNQYV